MNTAGTNNLMPVNRLFLEIADSDFAAFMKECDKFIDRHPVILDAIGADLERLAKEKKKGRLEDRRWHEFHNVEPLSGMEPIYEEINVEDLKLGKGRPRLMDAYVTFMFLMARGYEGGVSRRSFRDLTQESKTMTVIMANRDIPMPAGSTISENINAVSNATRELIHKKQLRAAKEEGLDDFKEMTIDSTAVEANTAWPTDSKILLGLVGRIWRTGNKLDAFGVENFSRHWMETWLKKIAGLDFKIINAKNNRERKKHYRRLFHFAENALEHLSRQQRLLKQRADLQSHCPTQRERLQLIVSAIQTDLKDTEKVICYSKKRIFEGKQTSSTKKILSLADKDAAYIKKGDRDPVIGYRPQLARSQNGFIGFFALPEGNANDSKWLVPATLGWIKNTGTVPSLLSTDDGYSSTEGKKLVEALGVEKVSFSGSKGKKILGFDQWDDDIIVQARRERSKVESSIFTVKHVFDFKRASRTGQESVEADLLEKVLAFNFWRAVRLRRQKASEPLRQAA